MTVILKLTLKENVWCVSTSFSFVCLYFNFRFLSYERYLPACRAGSFHQTQAGREALSSVYEFMFLMLILYKFVSETYGFLFGSDGCILSRIETTGLSSSPNTVVLLTKHILMINSKGLPPPTLQPLNALFTL